MSKSIEEKIRIKITNYKGKVVANWKVPKTKKQLKYAIEKLLKLYVRCKESKLLTKDLITAIKHYATALIQYSEVTAWGLTYSEYIKLLVEVKNLKIEEFTEEIVPEKVREHEKAICSFCKILLKYPARVVYRQGQKIVAISEPIGIHCLNTTVGKINDLINEVKVIVDKISLNDKTKNYKSTPISSYYYPYARNTEKSNIQHVVTTCQTQKFTQLSFL
ncbi:MAG: hypothetical protein NZ893_02940 [Candidatus Aenigmarchaeota archaeon]|nr:hypothetical protein [Candidatus Aenigmarchaeota archaeon]